MLFLSFLEASLLNFDVYVNTKLLSASIKETLSYFSLVKIKLAEQVKLAGVSPLCFEY